MSAISSSYGLLCGACPSTSMNWAVRARPTMMLASSRGRMRQGSLFGNAGKIETIRQDRDEQGVADCGQALAHGRVLPCTDAAGCWHYTRSIAGSMGL